ncbi:MAG: hypothetical protein JWR21_1492 [Herminiimonas sp.]|nr:hypothetical protein [Herminiimonas sp.]
MRSGLQGDVFDDLRHILWAEGLLSVNVLMDMMFMDVVMQSSSGAGNYECQSIVFIQCRSTLLNSSRRIPIDGIACIGELECPWSLAGLNADNGYRV